MTGPPYSEEFPITPDTTADEVISYLFDGSVFEDPGPNGRAQQLIRLIVGRGHATSLAKAIQFPDRWGEFPRTAAKRVTPVVPDANILRNDVLYSCRNDRRTVLVNGANSGFLRLFCAEHVIDEMYEHSEEWTSGKDVTRQQFLSRWFTDYLPMIRCIPEGSLPPDLWTSEEESRITVLETVDADDVPSARLAMAIRGFYLTEDRRAWNAVYGRTTTAEERHRWVSRLAAGGDTSELEEAFSAVGMIPALVVGGVVELFKFIYAKLGAPGVIVVLGGAALLGWRKSTPDSRRTISAGAREMLETFAGAYSEYQRRLDEFNAAVPDVPSWEALAAENPRPAVLTRACLQTLAREPWGQLSAEDLVPLLPQLPVGHSEQRVRAVLRGVDVFFEVWPGRWQVGMPHSAVCDYAAHLEAEHPDVWATHRKSE